MEHGQRRTRGSTLYLAQPPERKLERYRRLRKRYGLSTGIKITEEVNEPRQ